MFMEEEVSDDINNFETNESEHNSMYFDYAKRVPCIAHQIICAIKKMRRWFVKIKAYNSSCIQINQSVYEIWLE